MRLSEVIGFFANMMTALGLKEHPDGFNRQNIPSYLLDQMYSIDIGNIQGGPAIHTAHNFTMPVTLNVSFKDFRNPNLLRQSALAKAQEIFALILSPKVRLTKGIKDIRPTQTSITPLSQKNDNAAILSMGFELTLIYQF